MDNLTIKLEGDQKVVTILQGQAPPQREPKVINITGTIGAPLEFITKRKDQFQAGKVGIAYNRTNMTITLQANDTDFFGASVTGQLVINPDLTKFAINAEKERTIQELTKFLKMNKYFFADVDQCMTTIGNLQKFSASVKTQIDQANDGRGNKTEGFDVKVDSNLDLFFDLNMPVFKGQLAKKFRVDIAFDIRDKAVSIWLESPELQQVILCDRDTIIDTQLAGIRKVDENYIIVEQ